jgi:pyridoxine 4-dehydrogenase
MSAILDKAKDLLTHPNGKSYTLAGQPVGSTGFGLMGLTWRPNPVSQEQAFSAMKAALDNGANFFNGGELYGTPERNSLHLLREYFEKYPGDAKKVVLSIKGGLEKGGMKPDGSPENVRRSIDECLKVLAGTKKLDLFECARVDPKTPIEITVRTADEYVQAGKLGGISLSECSADTIRRAAKVAKISAVEVEYSLWATEIQDNGVLATCGELGIPIVAYSPLGRGFLTGQIKSRDDLAEDDHRRHLPRFSEENFPKNVELIHQLEQLAKRKGCTPGQIGVAWVKAQSEREGNPVIIPIPGATTVERVKENLVDVELSENDVKEIDSILASVEVHGERYQEGANALNFGDSPPEK